MVGQPDAGPARLVRDFKTNIDSLPTEWQPSRSERHALLSRLHHMISFDQHVEGAKIESQLHRLVARAHGLFARLNQMRAATPVDGAAR